MGSVGRRSSISRVVCFSGARTNQHKGNAEGVDMLKISILWHRQARTCAPLAKKKKLFEKAPALLLSAERGQTTGGEQHAQASTCSQASLGTSKRAHAPDAKALRGKTNGRLETCQSCNAAFLQHPSMASLSNECPVVY